jgi:nicotinate-nucleotide adenylyltransferase
MAPAILPPHVPGMRIGLFGGTFDPPHQAHLGAALLALKRLQLDRVWWLVTPGNPLKDTRGLASLDDRIAAARRLARHPRIIVSGIEAGIGVRYTYDTISYLVAHCRGVRFVWLMGADNLRSFHRWQRWRDIARLIPIAVIDRVGPSLYAAGGIAAQALSAARIPEAAAVTLAGKKPPVWVFLHGLKSPLSSTALRAERRSHARRGTARKKAGQKSKGTKGASGTKTAGTVARPGRSAAPRRAKAAGKRTLAATAQGKAGNRSRARTRVTGGSKARMKTVSKDVSKAGSKASGARGRQPGTTTKKPRRAKTARRGPRKG